MFLIVWLGSNFIPDTCEYLISIIHHSAGAVFVRESVCVCVLVCVCLQICIRYLAWHTYTNIATRKNLNLYSKWYGFISGFVANGLWVGQKYTLKYNYLVFGRQVKCFEHRKTPSYSENNDLRYTENYTKATNLEDSICVHFKKKNVCALKWYIHKMTITINFSH